jgi:hypothetical protein
MRINRLSSGLAALYFIVVLQGNAWTEGDHEEFGSGFEHVVFGVDGTALVSGFIFEGAYDFGGII